MARHLVPNIRMMQVSAAQRVRSSIRRRSDAAYRPSLDPHEIETASYLMTLVLYSDPRVLRAAGYGPSVNLVMVQQERGRPERGLMAHPLGTSGLINHWRDRGVFKYLYILRWRLWTFRRTQGGCGYFSTLHVDGSCPEASSIWA